MPDPKKRIRQYAGLALVLLVYVGGIIGWGWAALSVESGPEGANAPQTRVESSSGADSVEVDSEFP